MFLQSISSAFPENVLSQGDCWNLFRKSGGFDALKPRSRDLLEKILLGESGITTRRFARDDITSVFSLDAGGLHRAFAEAAPTLAAQAVARACAQAGLIPRELDALFVCTCTGYLCPGVSSYVSESLELRGDIFLQDLLGLGCGAALPMLEAARGFLSLRPSALVATVAVEICSAAFYLDDDPGVLISLCLFGDGAAAAVWRGEGNAGDLRMQNFHTVHQPEHREKIRFVNAGGKLKNQLHRSVPGLASKAVAGLYARRSFDPERILSHTGGRDVLGHIEAAIPGYPLSETRSVLSDYGNISSPCVLVALERALSAGPADRMWLTAFGAGFAAHSCELLR